MAKICHHCLEMFVPQGSGAYCPSCHKALVARHREWDKAVGPQGVHPEDRPDTEPRYIPPEHATGCNDVSAFYARLAMAAKMMRGDY